MHRSALAALCAFSCFICTAYAQSSVAGEGMAWQLPAIKDAAVQDYADRLYLGLQRQAHYLIGELRPWAEDPTLLLLTASKSNEHCIRPNTGTLAGLAMLYRFGPYDEKIVGVSRRALLQEKILPMMRYLAATHVTGTRPTSDGKPWGDAWQSASWAASLGMAAWWVGGDLPVDLAGAVRKVVAHEAGRFVNAEPPAQLKYDTKAEENAWNSKVISAAIVLMPEDPRRPQWEAAFQKWALSGWLRPADEHSSVLIDDRPLSEQFTGANIHDDFTLENHHIVHPDYMTAWSQTAGASTEFLLTGRKPPQALMHNVAGIYENLKWFWLPDGGLVYPSGQDWAVFRQVDWLYPNLLPAVLANDGEAWTLLDRSLEVLERMQARSESGAIYLPHENFFPSAQSDKLAQFAHGWLCLHFAGEPQPVEFQRSGVRRLDAAQVVLNRTSTAVHTLSWGNKIMAQCMPMQKDRLISPHDRSGIGYIMLPGEKKPLPLTLVEARIDASEDSFSAELIVDHGLNTILSHLSFASRADGTWTIREMLMASRGVTTSEVATGLVGILNNAGWIYERGQRDIAVDGEQYVVTSGSGKSFTAEDARELSVDAVLRIKSDKPLSIRYQAGTTPQRSRITDELYLNYIAGERSWYAGETISNWEVTIRCTPR